MSDVLHDHRRACDGFTAMLRRIDGRWATPTPCTEWDARGVLEHVIGFHDVLLLRPLGAKPTRPRDDPLSRWAVTVDALFGALARPGVLDEKGDLVGVLTTDVLVHTWDLSMAIGEPLVLEPDLCQIGLDRAMSHRDQFATSGMFDPPVPVAAGASVQDRLLGFLGRDPSWSPPGRSPGPR